MELGTLKGLVLGGGKTALSYGAVQTLNVPSLSPTWGGSHGPHRLQECIVVHMGTWSSAVTFSAYCLWSRCNPQPVPLPLT